MVENITALERLDQKNTAMNWSGSKRESYYPKYKCCGVIWPQKRVLFIWKREKWEKTYVTNMNDQE